MLSDAQWEMVEELLPRRTGRKGRPFSDPRQMLEGILYRLLRVLANGLHLAQPDGQGRHLGRDPSATSYTG